MIPLIITVVVLLVVGGVYFLLLNTKPCAMLYVGYRNTETGKCENFGGCSVPKKYIYDQSCIINTASWKTFQTNQYGFEVKYPPTLNVSEQQPFGGAVYGILFDNPSFNRTSAGRKNVFSILVFKDSDQMQNEYKSLGLQDKGSAYIDGFLAKKMLRPISPTNTLTETTVYLINDKNISIHFQGTDFHGISEPDMSEILKSFKFIK